MTLRWRRHGAITLTCLVFAAAATVDLWGADQAAPPAVGVAASRSELDDGFRDKLAALADKCEALQLADESAATRQWFVPRSSARQYLFLPATALLEEVENESVVKQQWRKKFRELRAEQAVSLFELSKRSLAEHRPSVAYQLLYETLHEDPDHAEARRALGYLRGAKQWQPRLSDAKASVGATKHARYGWPRGTYWRVESQHYQIVTDASPEAGIKLAEELELLLSIWRQAFFDFWADEAWLAERMNGAGKAMQSAKLQVVFFKDRVEYLGKLGEGRPQLELSSGLYVDKDRTAYFYAADPEPRSTWLHEASHQLFQELGKHASGVGERQNFWIVEGAAMYMESLAAHENYYTVGGWEANRVQLARYRALSGDYRLPLERLVVLGRKELQAEADLRKLYSQLAGLTHFLLDGEGGKLRPAAIAYVREVYQRADSGQSLAKLAGAGLGELDQQYLTWLKLSDAALRGVPDPQRLKQLSLGNTTVTDAGAEQLAGCRDLTWLDLTATGVSDIGLTCFSQCSGLQQLFLERSRVTADSLPKIAERFPQLEELDLSGLPIDDRSLAGLAPLKKLKQVYLRGTNVSAGGAAKLKQQSPNLMIDGP